MAVKHPRIKSDRYLYECPTRFAVWQGKDGNGWYVDRQTPYEGRTFDSFEEAINWAQKEARK